MPYSLYVRGRADRELSRLPPNVQERLDAAIDALADEPRPRGSKELQGREGRSVRVGDYRVIYEVDDTDQEIIVTKVAHRREVYRG